MMRNRRLDRPFGGRIFRIPNYSEGKRNDRDCPSKNAIPVRPPRREPAARPVPLDGPGLVDGDAGRRAGSPGRFKTLGQLHGRGPIRAGELAVLCGLTPSATTEVIEGLVADGFARRVDDPTDRRAVMIGLTAEGDAELERLRALLTAAMVKVFDGLSADQKTRLRAAVADINDILIAPSAQKETRIVR